MTHSTTHPYDALTPDNILDAIEAEGYEVNGRLFALNSYENRVYQIGIEDKPPLIAKFYRPNRWSEAQIREEHRFSSDLVAAGIPIVAPIKMPSRETLGQHDNFYFALFEQRGGQAPDTSVPDTLYRLGQWLGQLHNIGAVSPFVHRASLDILPELEANNRFLLENDWIPKDLRPAWDSLIPDLLDYCARRIEDAGATTRLRLHGDCHAGNILVRDEQMLFVDLDKLTARPETCFHDRLPKRH